MAAAASVSIEAQEEVMADGTGAGVSFHGGGASAPVSTSIGTSRRVVRLEAVAAPVEGDAGGRLVG